MSLGQDNFFKKNVHEQLRFDYEWRIIKHLTYMYFKSQCLSPKRNRKHDQNSDILCIKKINPLPSHSQIQGMILFACRGGVFSS